MEIRRARDEDVSPIVERLWLPFAREMAEIDPFDELAEDITEPALEYRQELRDREDVAMWVAVEDGSYEGLVMVEKQVSAPVFQRGDTAHIHELFVHETHRGTGLADALLERVQSWAEDEACEYLSLDVNARNDRALAYYRKVGFEVKRHRMVRPL